MKYARSNSQIYNYLQLKGFFPPRRIAFNGRLTALSYSIVEGVNETE